jgi:radical SAM superfamily enzyme YgiQ (UPF0313 family)
MARRFVKNCKELGLAIHGDYIIGLPGETPESIQRTMDFAQELDTETIQVSIAHAYPGTELYEESVKHGYLGARPMSDSLGHQLPHLEYPGLDREAMMAAVNRFYDSYYFRPRVAWRIVRNALRSADERKRLYHEAVEFLRLRAERLKYARSGSRGRAESAPAAAGPAAQPPA